MSELIGVAEGLLGLGGGGPLVDAHDDEHQTNTSVDATLSYDGSDDHEIGSHNTSFDSHNVTIQQYYSEEHHQEVHSGGGGGGGGGGRHHAHFDPQVYEMQKHLQEEGFDPGSLDGIMGPRTQHALMEDEQYEMHHHHGDEDGSSGKDSSYSVDHYEHSEHHEHHQGHAAPHEQYDQQQAIDGEY